MKLLTTSLAVASAYQAPLAARAPTSTNAVSMSAIKVGDIGTTRPLGVWDPLGLMTSMPDKYRRWQEMEIKHGRISMLAVLHVIVTGAGCKWAGYCSYLSFPPLKFEDIPAGTLASWEALPQAGWAQIVALVAILDNSLFAQDPNREAGDVVGDRIPWVRYSDPAVKEFKLNAERNNRPRCDDGHRRHDHPRGPHGQPDLADSVRAGQLPAHSVRGRHLRLDAMRAHGLGPARPPRLATGRGSAPRRLECVRGWATPTAA